MTEETQMYPRILVRYKAVFVDVLVFIIFILLISYLFSLFQSVAEWVRIAAVVFIWVLYDPLFTSLFGGTIGHMVNGLRVRRINDESRNIIFPLALIRFALKYFLGAISFFTVMSNKKGRAIHDMLAGSVVIYKHQPVE